MPELKITEYLWAVLIDDDRFALNAESGRYQARHRKQAAAFCKELREHLTNSCCRVVRVRVTMEVVDNAAK